MTEAHVHACADACVPSTRVKHGGGAGFHAWVRHAFELFISGGEGLVLRTSTSVFRRNRVRDDRCGHLWGHCRKLGDGQLAIALFPPCRFESEPLAALRVSFISLHLVYEEMEPLRKVLYFR